MQALPKDVSSGRGVAKNALFLLFAKVITTGMSFVLVLYLARSLGDTLFGRYTFTLGYSNLFIIISDAGLNNLMTRSLARDKESVRDYLGMMIPLRLVMSILAFIFAVFIINIFDYQEETRTVVYLMGIVLLLIGPFGELYTHLFEGYEQMQYIAILDSVRRGFDLTLAVLVVSMGYGLETVVAVFMVGAAVHVLLSWVIGRNRLGIRIRLHIDIRAWKLALKEGFPFAMMLAFMAVLSSIDITMLERMRSEQEVGWYGSAARITKILSDIPLMVASAMFPAVSRMYQHEPDCIRPLFLNVVRILTLLALPIAIGTTILSGPIIYLLFGEAYISAAPALTILIWAVAINFINMPMVLLLSAINRQHFATMAMGFSAVINILLNYYLIPDLGIIGASIATVASQATLVFICMGTLRPMFRQFPFNRFVSLPLIAALIMGVAIWVMSGFAVLPVIVCGALIYGATLYTTGVVTREEYISLMRSLRHNR